MSRIERKKRSGSGAGDGYTGSASAKKKGQKLARFKSWFSGLKTWKKVLFVAGIVLLVLVLTVGAFAFSYFNKLYGQIHNATPEDYDLSLVDVDGYYNILLLGVDSRDMDNLKGTRSDAIMIVSINAETSDVKILSVYRDTYLKLGDTSTYDKITHACVYGGPEMTMKSLNQALDLNISNYVVVNFKAVADLVDAVGGIEVDVQDYEIQQLNKYTIQTANNIGREDYALVEQAGPQTLEGVQAVSYGRIRKGVGDDFKRTERMRTVITLVTEKMKGMSFGELRDIIDMMTPQVQTNLSMGDILGLAIRLPQYNIIGTDGWPYNVSTGYINGVSYVFPSDLAANVTELHQKFFGQEDYVPSAMVSTISGTIASRIEAERNAGNIENEQQEQIDTSQGSVVTEPPQSEGSGNGSESQTGGTDETGKPATKPEGDGQTGGSEDTPEGDDQTGGSENTPGGDDQTEGSQDGNDGETGGGSGGQTGGSENTPGGGGQTGDNAGAGGTGNGNNNTNAAIAA